MSAANMQLFHVRPKHLRHDFPDEYSQLVWSADLRLSEPLVTSPLYTLEDRRVVIGEETSWSWVYRGLYHDGAKSHWITEEEAMDSFTPLQLDVFHALWEVYHPQFCPRPAASMTKRNETN